MRVREMLGMIFLLLSSAVASAATPNEAFALLKSLEGEWVYTPEKGKTFTVSYEVVSGGTAVLERLGDMISVYHMDDGRLLMTHYCSAGNQPRLVLVEDNSTKLTFDFLDATNLGASQDHINGLELSLNADGSLSQSWRSVAQGEENRSNFQFNRMPKAHSPVVVWFTLNTGDLGRAESFYGQLFGWQFTRQGEGQEAFSLVLANGAEIGDLTANQNGAASGSSNTTLYFPVDDLIGTFNRALKLGATKLLAPMNLPGGHGAIAIVIDADGNNIGMYMAKTI